MYVMEEGRSEIKKEKDVCINVELLHVRERQRVCVCVREREREM